MVNSEGVKELKLISALKKIMSKVSRWVNTIPAPPKKDLEQGKDVHSHHYC